MPSSEAFDINRHVLVLGGRRINGFAEGTAITITRNAETASTTVGVDGLGMIAIHYDRSGKIEVSLMPNSDSGGYLSSLVKLGRLGIKPLSFEDLEGNVLLSADKAVVGAMPETTIERGIKERKWTILLLDMEYRPSNNAT